MSQTKTPSLTFAGRGTIQALYHLHAVALELGQTDIELWALSAHNKICSLLSAVPRDNPFKPLIPEPPTSHPPKNQPL